MTVICIAGPSGSGKSTLSGKLVEHYGKENCLVISIDDYYKDLSHIIDAGQRAKTNFDDPSSIDFALLAKHLHDLKNGLTVRAPEWDFATHTRKSVMREINPEGKTIIIIEGIFALLPAVHKLSDVDIYVDTDPVLCALRRMVRDTKERGRTVESVLEQYERAVLPMQKIHVEPTKQFADVVVKDSHDVAPVLQFIAEAAKDELAVFSEGISSIKTSIGGLFGGWMNYAGRQLERADNAAAEFLLEDAHPEVRATTGLK